MRTNALRLHAVCFRRGTGVERAPARVLEGRRARLGADGRPTVVLEGLEPEARPAAEFEHVQAEGVERRPPALPDLEEAAHDLDGVTTQASREEEATPKITVQQTRTWIASLLREALGRRTAWEMEQGLQRPPAGTGRSRQKTPTCPRVRFTERACAAPLRRDSA